MIRTLLARASKCCNSLSFISFVFPMTLFTQTAFNLYCQIMKKILPLLFVLLITFAGCKALKKLTQFYVSYNTSVTVPSSLGIGSPVSFATPDVTTNSSQEFSGHNTDKNLINTINIEEMKLTIASPNTQTFDFMKDIEIYMSAGSLPKIMIASMYNIPQTGLTTLQLNVVGDDLKQYIIQDTIKISVKVTTRETVAQDTKIDAQSKFLVKAKIF